MTLSADERKALFEIARGVVAAALDGRDFHLAEPSSENLRRPSGVFVTLTLDEELRGCIGSVMPVEPLYFAVAQNALNAAFRDPRFPPLTTDEFARVEFEISVMSLPEPVTQFESIEVGRDGLIVRQGRYAGLLLPQVATEYGWDREKFLAHTCLKAGLPRDAWKGQNCRIEKFTAEVFSELPQKA